METKFKKHFSARSCYRVFVRSAMDLSAGLVCALGVFIIGYVVLRGVPHLSWKLLSTKPSYLDGTIGILPDLWNTVYIVVATLLLILPLGVGAAVYLNEYAKNRRVVAVIAYAAEALCGIPSIVYGLAGMLLFSNRMGTSLFAGALTLAVMNLPTVMRNTQESLRTVPQSYREGALALGAGKWRMVRTVVLPGCIDGVVTGCILSVGRIIGESAALLFTAGFAHTLNGFFAGLGSPGATLSVALYVYAKEQGEFDVAFAIAAILMMLACAMNLTVSYIGRRMHRKQEQ